jgi:thiamine biosynthesis lipoprotein ApbE
MSFLPRLACVLLLFPIAACRGPATMRLHGPTMGTTWSATLVVPAGVDAGTLESGIQAELDRVVAQMSTYEDDSHLVRFNRAPAGSWQVLPPELAPVAMIRPARVSTARLCALAMPRYTVSGVKVRGAPVTPRKRARLNTSSP